MAGILNVDQITNSAGNAGPSFTYAPLIPVSPTAGYVWTCQDNLGNGAWNSNTTSANIAANDSDVTFTSASNPFQICTPTAHRTYTMPASLTAGVQWIFVNKSTTDGNYITLQSSGSNTIAVLPPSCTIIITPITSTPTTAANWLIIARQSTGTPVSYTPSFSAGFGTVTNAAGYYSLKGNDLQIVAGCTTGTLTGTAGSISLPTFATMNSIAPTAVGNIVGSAACNSASGGQFVLLLSEPGTSTSVVYTGPQIAAANLLSNAGGSAIFSNSSAISFNFKVTIAN